MKVVAVVPIKLNNERLPNKNIKKFTNGLPLCRYIFNTLLKVSGIDEIYVYCSDEKIKEYIPNGIKFLKREKYFDESNIKMNAILKCFANEIYADVYLMTHATSPFINYLSINEALQKVITDKNDSAFSVNKVEDFLWKDNKPFNYDLSNIPRTQDIDKLYSETSGFYIFKRNIIIEHGRRIGFNPYLKVVSKIEGIDIDEEEDFVIADAIYQAIYSKENDNEC